MFVAELHCINLFWNIVWSILNVWALCLSKDWICRHWRRTFLDSIPGSLNLKGRKKDGSSICWLTSKMATTVCLSRPGQTPSGFPTGVAGAQALKAFSDTFLHTLAGSWIKNRTAGTQTNTAMWDASVAGSGLTTVPQHGILLLFITLVRVQLDYVQEHSLSKCCTWKKHLVIVSPLL